MEAPQPTQGTQQDAPAMQHPPLISGDEMYAPTTATVFVTVDNQADIPIPPLMVWVQIMPPPEPVQGPEQ